jgi:hypothetical protein
LASPPSKAAAPVGLWSLPLIHGLTELVRGASGPSGGYGRTMDQTRLGPRRCQAQRCSMLPSASQAAAAPSVPPSIHQPSCARWTTLLGAQSASPALFWRCPIRTSAEGEKSSSPPWVGASLSDGDGFTRRCSKRRLRQDARAACSRFAYSMAVHLLEKSGEWSMPHLLHRI